MKIKMKICMENNPNQVYEETHVVNGTDPEKAAQDMIDDYNRSIPTRGGEPRKLLGVEILSDVKEHEWVKTNLVTKMRAGQIYDTYECQTCGITAKVFGLNPDKIRDPKYKAEKYAICSQKVKRNASK